jgi:pyruvate formate lyase activating enzyme
VKNKETSSAAVCDLCPHGCKLLPGQVGICKARTSSDSLNYGKLTSIALDPIEKKPLSHFYPGTKILSIGSFGCNLSCPFCQNYEISMAGVGDLETIDMTPEKIATEATRLVSAGNIGVAYTYNEPLISYEFVRDTAICVKEKGLQNVLVTNGYINQPYLKAILPLVDAMNIDLKAYNQDFYHRIGGNLEIVKRNIELSAAHCHVELTTLIIDGENDSEAEFEAMCDFIRSISPDIPLHISRFFPRYKYAGKKQTSADTLYRLEKIAAGKLKYVKLGNI